MFSPTGGCRLCISAWLDGTPPLLALDKPPMRAGYLLLHGSGRWRWSFCTLDGLGHFKAYVTAAAAGSWEQGVGSKTAAADRPEAGSCAVRFVVPPTGKGLWPERRPPLWSCDLSDMGLFACGVALEGGCATLTLRFRGKDKEPMVLGVGGGQANADAWCDTICWLFGLRPCTSAGARAAAATGGGAEQEKDICDSMLVELMHAAHLGPLDTSRPQHATLCEVRDKEHVEGLFDNHPFAAVQVVDSCGRAVAPPTLWRVPALTSTSTASSCWVWNASRLLKLGDEELPAAVAPAATLRIELFCVASGALARFGFDGGNGEPRLLAWGEVSLQALRATGEQPLAVDLHRAFSFMQQTEALCKEKSVLPAQLLLRSQPHSSSRFKWLFLVRHAQSRWNQATGRLQGSFKKMMDGGTAAAASEDPLAGSGALAADSNSFSQNVNGMLKAITTVDHGLSEAGKQQAEALSRILLAARAEHAASEGRSSESSEGLAVGALLNCTKIYCSPLLRAITTAHIAFGLGRHRAICEGGITLLADAREQKGKRGLLSLDAVRGAGGQSQIDAALRAELASLYGEDGARAFDVGGAGDSTGARAFFVDANDCAVEPPRGARGAAGIGEASVRDATAQVEGRARAVLDTVRFSQEDASILVGHSLFFQHMFRSCLSPSFLDREPELACRLAEHKLENCAVVALRLDCGAERSPSGNPARPIMDAQLLFGSSLEM